MCAAFDHIADPNDPAWTGHADEVAAAARRAGLQRAIGIAVCSLAVLAGIGLATIAMLRDDRPGAAQRSRTIAAAASAERVGTVPMTDANALASTATGASSSGASAADPRPAASGSGWAPAEATISQAKRYPHLTGDLAGLRPSLIATLDDLAERLGRTIEVISGWRTHHEQKELYGMYQRGTGNLAAVPGTSMHETGDAADVYIDGVALADVPGAKAMASGFGLHFPVPGEAWHVESR